MTTSQTDITNTDTVLMTYNMNNTQSTATILRMLSTHAPDILALQEVNSTLLDKDSRAHRIFRSYVSQYNYTIHMSKVNMTLLKNSTLGPYISQAQSSPEGRLLITPLQLTSDFTLYIINTYGCQKGNDNYVSINTALINYLDNFHKDKAQTNYHVIPIGDMNIDPSKDFRVPANILQYYVTKFQAFSSTEHFKFLAEENNVKNIKPFITYNDKNKGKTNIDHICLPFTLLPSTTDPKDQYAPKILDPNDNKSPHKILKQCVIIPLQDADSMKNLDPLPPIYRILSSIPLKPGPDPTNPDAISDWFQPDDALIAPSKLADKTDLINKAHAIQRTDTELKELEDKVTQQLSTLQQTLLQHYAQSDEIIPRTKIIQQQISDAYATIDTGIHRTLAILDLYPDLPSEKKQPVPTLDLRLQSKVDAIHKTIAIIKGSKSKANTDNLPKTLRHLTSQAKQLLNVVNKIETKTTTNINDYTALVRLRQQRKEEAKKRKQQQEGTNNSQQSENKQTPKFPPLSSLDSSAPVQTDEDHFIAHQTSYLKYIQHTKAKIVTMSQELSNFSTSSQTLNRNQALAFVKDIQARYSKVIKNRTRNIINQIDNITIDFHTLFGDTAQPAKILKNKTNPPAAANLTIPIYTNPLAAPTHVPAIGPKQQKEATRATQQQQADLPPGKALHFVDIKEDDVGPCGIKVDFERQFTRKNLTDYHPNAKEFPKRVQEEILEAHQIFPDITKYLQKKHEGNTNSPHTQWPYQAKVEQCSATNMDMLTFTNPVPSMITKIRYVPSTARLNGFTLNVLARLHPCWMRALDKLTNFILVTRILPPQLKTTGRVLIDKPDSTDKRPISILHAYDSYIDTIVATSLSTAVEKLQVYDDTIAAYRPGYSCADCTLNHLLAVQDTLGREEILLCQLDEDKEKFFDRITPELQMLPFHLMGFPLHGYIEWIAESLHDLTVLTKTPYGTVTTSFLCGVRQGSALSCAIANAVAWLSAAPWAMPLDGFPVPTGHTPYQLHPYDIQNGNPATLYKHSYCDDSSAYISATTLDELIDLIDRDVQMSNVISIVTKLSINAKKSHIRIYNLSSRTKIPQFSYISWHHKTKTVRIERIPTHNMGALTETALMRLFGTYINNLGYTNGNHAKHFPKMHASRKAFANRKLMPTTFTSQYSALVTSTLGFNILAMTYKLEDAVKDDHITLYTYAAKAYNVIPPADSFFNIFLPTTTLGHSFKGSLTIQLAAATARELFVNLNSPHHLCQNLLQTRMRAMLHNLTTSTSTYDKQHTIPHAINQLALLGIFIQPTNYPIVNQAISILITDDEATTKLGYPVLPRKPSPSPLSDILTEANTKYTIIEDIYRSLLITMSNLYNEQSSPFHEAQTYSECILEHSPLTPRANPAIPAPQRRLLLQTAARELMPSYNHLSHFLELSLHDHAAAHDKSLFLNEKELPVAEFTMHSLFGTAQFPSWNDTPITSLRRFTAMQRIPLQNTGHCIIQRIFNRYASPLIFSSDSAYDHQTNTTVAASILMHLDTHIEQDVLNISPKPVLVRNHILAQSYGTSFTDNNMGESHALTLSLNSCPLRAPTIFLLDSRVVLLQVVLYFHPHSKTIRQQLRKHIHTTSMHHFSELSHALKCHWPDPSRRASRISYPSSVPHHVRNQFLEIIEQLTTDIGASNFCNLNLPSPTGSLVDHDETITENTVGLQIGHHLFLHINSHQLTNYGNIRKKNTEAGQVEIPPQPNFAFAMANTWADRAASRMAHSLQGNLPENLCTDIPHPPITTLQYTFHHNARTVNSDITQYMHDQFVNHNYKLAIEDPAQWYLQFSCFFSDPLGTFHNSTTLRKIAQEKAHSQMRLVKIDKAYRQCMQQQCHPTDKLNPKQFTSTMLRCPFCNHSTFPAAAAHYHLACTHRQISYQRYKLTEPINDTLHTLDIITTYIIDTVLPSGHQHRFIPRFTLFLRAAIQNATLVTPLSDHEQQTFADTTIYPPFAETGYPTKPHWADNLTVQDPYAPTTAHYTHLMGPSHTNPIYPVEHTAIIAMLGLLPTNTHTAIESYLTMLEYKFQQAFRIHQSPQERIDDNPVTIEMVLNHLTSNGTAKNTTIIQMLTDAKTLKPQPLTMREYCDYLVQQLLQQLQHKAETLQTKIQYVLNKYKTAKITQYKKSLQNPDPSPTPATKPEVPKKTITKRKRNPCQGVWCTLKQFAAMPYTMTATSASCSQCNLMQEAVQLATKLTAQLLTRTSAMAIISQYTPIDPHQMHIRVMANNIATSPVPLDEIRDIICNTIPMTTVAEISPKLNFLHPDDVQYNKPHQELQNLVLQHIAYTSLISTTPSLTHEFPSLRDPYHIHEILTTAVTMCVCTKSKPKIINDTHICTKCSHLIAHKQRQNQRKPSDMITCISCDRALHQVKYPNEPCETCVLISVLIQHNPASTWYTLTHRTTPNMETVVHETPYSYMCSSMPKAVPLDTLPPEDIFIPCTKIPLPEQYPHTEDPDFHFQDMLEDQSFLGNRIYPPRPPPIAFPKQYATPTINSQHSITNITTMYHPDKFHRPHPVFLSYSIPTFPLFDNIQQSTYGYYPEAHFETNIPHLAHALPHLHIKKVPFETNHPIPQDQLPRFHELQTVITWSFKDYPKRDPNQNLGQIPETFLLTVYPSLQNNPFQIRMFFYPGPQVDDLPQRQLPDTSAIHFLDVPPRESPTLYVLAAIYHIATLPPQCVNLQTLHDFRILKPQNIRHLSQEMAYLHAILLDDNYLESMKCIHPPWTLSYQKSNNDKTQTKQIYL